MHVSFILTTKLWFTSSLICVCVYIRYMCIYMFNMCTHASGENQTPGGCKGLRVSLYQPRTDDVPYIIQSYTG